MKLTADRQTPARSLVKSVWCEPTTKIVKSSKKCYIQFNVYRILVILDESLKWVSWQWFRKVVSMSLGWRSTSFFFAGTYFARRLREVCYLFYASQHIEGARKRSRRWNRSEEQISLFSLSAFSFLHFYYKLHHFCFFDSPLVALSKERRPLAVYFALYFSFLLFSPSFWLIH